jgi:hypothetical protein
MASKEECWREGDGRNATRWRGARCSLGRDHVRDGAAASMSLMMEDSADDEQAAADALGDVQSAHGQTCRG